ncbi:heme ABC transporter ATP-binding protein [Granulosicoccus sp. 3-233]
MSLEQACLQGRQGWRVDHVSLQLYPGEVLALLGPNGAGKSSILKLMSGEVACDSGCCLLAGQDMSSMSPLALARRRAVLPQQSELAFGFQVHEVVMMGRSVHRGCGHRLDQEVVDWAMLKTGVSDLAEQDYLSLSGGERQRVHLARVLAQIGPDARGSTSSAFLLLDEPTAALDLAHQHQVLSLARQLASEMRIGVLTILHDLNLAALYANRIALMKQGRVVGVGLPQEILTPQRIQQVFDTKASVMAHPHRPRKTLVVTG